MTPHSILRTTFYSGCKIHENTEINVKKIEISVQGNAINYKKISLLYGLV